MCNFNFAVIRPGHCIPIKGHEILYPNVVFWRKHSGVLNEGKKPDETIFELSTRPDFPDQLTFYFLGEAEILKNVHIC